MPNAIDLKSWFVRYTEAGGKIMLKPGHQPKFIFTNDVQEAIFKELSGAATQRLHDIAMLNPPKYAFEWEEYTGWGLESGPTND